MLYACGMNAVITPATKSDAGFTLAAFRPKQRLALEIGGWRVRTVETRDQLEQTFRLRSEVFLEERLGRPAAALDDADDLDLFGDHLVVEEPATGAVVATYRLMSSLHSPRFYTQEEFHIAGFLREPGVKLELSRACVKAGYRNGLAIAMIWKGLARYAEIVGARYLFGCSTVWTDDPSVAYGLLESLGEQRRAVSFGVHPSPAFRFPCRPAPGTGVQGAAARKYLPSLMRAYLNAGAKIHGDPALDHRWRCSDFFTVIDLERLHPRVASRFLSKES